MKLTNQRGEIISYLQRTRSHPDAKEIYNKVKKKLPRISLGTIYRNLDFLAKNKKIIQRQKHQDEVEHAAKHNTENRIKMAYNPTEQIARISVYGQVWREGAV